MCSRTTDPIITAHTLTLSDIKHSFDKLKFDEISYCGNDGDPLMAREFLRIVEFFAPMKQSIHTNGSLRSKEFWKKLASIPNVIVTFALDGSTADVHQKYRINTDFEFILNNAKTFNEAGGESWWQFIVFEHNEHQINEAKQLAKELGFAKFELVYSRRDDVGDIKTIKFLDYKPLDTIDCKAKRLEEIYIRSDGEVFPCVYQGSRNTFSGLNIKDRHLKDIIYDIYFDNFNFENSICHYNCRDMIRNKRAKTSL